MSKLEPQVGDKVTLTHENGDTATIVATGTNGYGICGTSNYFSFKEGWSVTEVHERPKPAPGTFVKGVTLSGYPFRAVVCGDYDVSGGYASGDGWTCCLWGWGEFASWEVVQ